MNQSFAYIVEELIFAGVLIFAAQLADAWLQLATEPVRASVEQPDHFQHHVQLIKESNCFTPPKTCNKQKHGVGRLQSTICGCMTEAAAGCGCWPGFVVITIGRGPAQQAQ